MAGSQASGSDAVLRTAKPGHDEKCGFLPPVNSGKKPADSDTS